MTPEQVLATPPRVLTQAPREFSFSEGYIRLEAILGDEWVRKLRAATEEMVERSRKVTRSDTVFDLEPDHSVGPGGDAHRCRQLFPREAIGKTIVNGGHDRVIEHVRIDVQPETIVGPVIAREVRDCIAGGYFNAARADARQIDRLQLRRKRLTSVRGLLLCIAVPERDDVFVLHERAATFDVRQDVGTPARGERQLHGRRFAVRVRLRVIEIGVTIHKQQPVAPPSFECEQVAEQDRTVSAEYHRKLTAVHHFSDDVRQRL